MAENSFPAVGHRYLVDFNSFKVELFFQSDTSMTWTTINPDGSKGGSETETIAVEPLRRELFLVTWQESDKTTVVHVEDYERNTIITNITDPGDPTATPPRPPSLLKFHGTMKRIG